MSEEADRARELLQSWGKHCCRSCWHYFAPAIVKYLGLESACAAGRRELDPGECFYYRDRSEVLPDV